MRKLKKSPRKTAFRGVIYIAKAKAAKENAAEEHSAELQRIVEFAKEHNACRFRSDGYTASFSKNGRFLLKAEVVK